MDHHKEETLTALLHPVALMICSNHHTRMTLINNGKFVPVVGALLGKQSSRTIEIQNCFEIETMLENNDWVLNSKHFEDRAQMFQETFSNQTFLGFYVVGDYQHIDRFDEYLYQVAKSKSETVVVLLKMSPLLDPSIDKLPINVFESVFSGQSGEHSLAPVQVKVISDIAEQISTDHAAKFTVAADKGETTTSKKLNEQANAMKMFSKGLTASLDYLKTVDESKTEGDPEILRDLHKLAIKLEFLKNHKIKAGSSNSMINEKLIVLLSMDNKISGSIFSIINKLNMIINEHNSSSSESARPQDALFGRRKKQLNA